MSEASKQLRAECVKASHALAAWFESQGMTSKQAIGTMAVLIAAIVSEGSKGNILKAINQYDITAKLIEGIVVDMVSKKRD